MSSELSSTVILTKFMIQSEIIIFQTKRKFISLEHNTSRPTNNAADDITMPDKKALLCFEIEQETITFQFRDRNVGL